MWWHLFLSDAFTTNISTNDSSKIIYIYSLFAGQLGQTRHGPHVYGSVVSADITSIAADSQRMHIQGNELSRMQTTTHNTMTFRDATMAPLRKLSVDLIKTYKHINEVGPHFGSLYASRGPFGYHVTLFLEIWYPHHRHVMLTMLSRHLQCFFLDISHPPTRLLPTAPCVTQLGGSQKTCTNVWHRACCTRPAYLVANRLVQCTTYTV